MRLHAIIPGKLYIGGQTRGIRSRNQLVQARVLAVLCLIRDADPFVRDGYGDYYRHIPLTDGKHPEQQAADIERAVHQVHTWLGDKMYPVFVHCRAGRNRSALVAALVVRRLVGLTGAEAVAWVRERRPRALANPAFVDYLLALPLGGPPTYHELRQRELAVELNLFERRGVGMSGP